MKSGDHGNSHFAEEIAPAHQLRGIFFWLERKRSEQHRQAPANDPTTLHAEQLAEFTLRAPLLVTVALVVVALVIVALVVVILALVITGDLGAVWTRERSTRKTTRKTDGE